MKCERREKMTFEEKEKREELKEVTIYTDGACSGNPGPGGYGVVLLYNDHRKEISGGFRLTTNNRMEIYAAIAGLSALKCRCKVKLYTDSRYLADAMNKGWVKRWKANGWMRNKKERALNVDLWEQLLCLCEKHEVEFLWVRGHDGNVENERCDELSTTAARGENLPIDQGYENAGQ
ncbi:ribonuclease HI [Acetomicrobium sp. UBA5826]|uniref:ribonuclease HI n=1 Tax=Acetomicrobium sp. UBA5826 TaxID=1946039 RepID=UPI00257CC98E|nr:ribonuclease HI [Acetomicrobium sp. UBA5826]